MENKIAAGTGRQEGKLTASSCTGIIAHVGYGEIEHSFLVFAESCGIAIPGPIQADGQIHRFRLTDAKSGSRDGAYQVWPEGMSYDGRPHGWIQDHRDGGEKYFWQFFSKDNPPPKRELSAAEQLAAREQRDRDEEQARQARINKLRGAWSSYRKGRSIEEAIDHSYLSHKHCQPRGGFFFNGVWCGLRVGDMISSSGNTLKNLLLIPMMNIKTEKFCALHRVFGWAGPDGKYGKGWCCAAGGVFPIALDARCGPIVVAEGIATGLSLYDLFIDDLDERETTVLICCDAGNLQKQAPAIRAKCPDRRVLVSADNDDAGRRASAACIAAGFDSTFSFGEAVAS